MSERIKMQERSGDERKKDFKEVNLGYTREDARKEAERCLQCKTPFCLEGCPVEINIPAFIKAIADDDMEKAILVLKQKNNLPAICGRVCPQETQCELKCILGKQNKAIAIGNLERYAADWERINKKDVINQDAINRVSLDEMEKVAIIGSGPAGLTCAGDLVKLGFDVTIFESLHDSGGVLRYGIPQFRLSREVLNNEINNLKKNGVKIELNTLVGRTKTFEDLLKEDFNVVFIGTGAGLPKFLGIEGENLNNVYSANEFLVRTNLMNAAKFPEYHTPIYVGKKVVVVGGGNTAIDSARTALRLGSENVTIVYRRSLHELPARKEEIEHAMEEGVNFMFLTNPLQFIGDETGNVKDIECMKMELGETDDKGRCRPVVIPNSNFIIAADMVVLAVGLNPNPVFSSLTKGIEVDARGYIKVDENYMTTIKGVFAGGDVTGGDTVIQAMGMGKRAAKAIVKYLENL